MATFFKYRLRPFIAAATFTAIFGSIFSSINVINHLSNIGAETSLPKRLSMISYDLAHFAPHYLIFVAIAFLIAMSAAGLTSRLINKMRSVRYFTAGFIAIMVMLALMKHVFYGVQIVAGARDNIGLIFQAITGGVGGWIFHHLSDKRLAKQKP